MNDVMMFDIHRKEAVTQYFFSELTVKKRTNHCGFKIDDSIFSIGGQGQLKVLDEFIEFNIRVGKPMEARVESGIKLIKPTYSSAITPVFYKSKMGADGNLSLKSLSG